MPAELYAFVTKKRGLPVGKFETVAMVEVPTSICCVYVCEAVP